MIRLFIILSLICFVLVWLGRGSSDKNKKSKSWLRAGGLLGLLIIFSRLTHIPLAQLLRLFPFMMHAFKREAGAQQQSSDGQQASNKPGSMTRKEAQLILGVQEGASKEDITKAHRKLIRQHHPDTGGNDFLAAKVNEARDVLLK